jgi:hypothetical protein
MARRKPTGSFNDHLARAEKELKKSLPKPQKAANVIEKIVNPPGAYKPASRNTKPYAVAVKNDKNSDGINEVFNIWQQDMSDSLGMQKIEQIGSAIPYIFNVVGDLLVNPSTVSPSTFKKMVESDPVIFACMLNTITSIISTLGGYIHENESIQKHIRYAINKNKRGFRTLCKDILTGVYAGFSRQEKIWDYDEFLESDIIVDTVPLPQNSLIFRVNPYGDLQEEGVGQYVFNSFFPGFSSLFSYGMGNVFQPLVGGLTNGAQSNYFNTSNLNGMFGVDPYASSGDLDIPYRTYMISPVGLVWLPTDKTIGFEYYGVTNNKNPYGRPIGRSIYNAWVAKYGILQSYLLALKKKAAPMLIGYARPEVPAGAYDPNNPQGGAQAGQPGAAIQDATTALAGAFAQYSSTDGIVLAGMDNEIFHVDKIDIQGELSAYVEALKWCDEQIMTGLMTPKTMFGSDGKGSYALSYSQRDIHAMFVNSVRDDLKECLLLQYIKPMIEEAFDESEHDNEWGDFDIQRTSIDEQVKLGTLYADMTESGVLDITNIADMNQMRENLGFQPLESIPSYAKKLQKALTMPKGESGSSPSNKREKMDSTNKPYAHSEN